MNKLFDLILNQMTDPGMSVMWMDLPVPKQNVVEIQNAKQMRPN